MLRLVTTPIDTLVEVHSDPFVDDRGAFARVFDHELFQQAGLRPGVMQVNRSRNRKSGTLRGLHLQVPPRTESKLVMCVRGSIYDVAVDLRPDSRTFGQSYGVSLGHESTASLYVPPLFAHGFITTSDDTEVMYLSSCAYSPEHERGIRWDDPRLAIDWPIEVTSVSSKDMAWPTADLDQLRTELHELLEDGSASE